MRTIGWIISTGYNSKQASAHDFFERWFEIEMKVLSSVERS